MKKYLLLVCLMALVQVAFANNLKENPVFTETLIRSDSVVIEFGKSGRVVIIVDNKEDFEKLKLMNINQIIRELDLEQNPDTGEMVIVQVQTKNGTTKDVVRVREDGNETEVNVGGIRVYVDESGANTKVKVETGTRKAADPPFRTYFNVDLGKSTTWTMGNSQPQTTLMQSKDGEAGKLV